MTELVILFCLILFLALLCFCAFTKRYLVALYALCYSVPFLGLIRGIWTTQVVLWPIGNYSFDVSATITERLTEVWCVGLVGSLSALLFFCKKQAFIIAPQRLFSVELKDVKIIAWFFFIVSVVYILFRLRYAEEVLGVFTGVESFAICSIVVFFAYSLLMQKKSLLLLSAALIVAYAYANALTGDRDFIVLVVGVTMGSLFYYHKYINFKVLLLVAAVMILLMGGGVYVSMERMNVPVTEENIAQYFLFNSWNAIILPVVDQLTNHWNGDHMRYGQTYADMFMSLAPSPFYSYFDLVKPISQDNPASWYYIFGLGGMHAAGVAFENFGLPGVFIDTALSTVLLRLLDRRGESRSYLRYLLYMLCAASVMHWLWYGAMYILNALVFYLFLAGMCISVGVCRQFLIRNATESRA